MSFLSAAFHRPLLRGFADFDVLPFRSVQDFHGHRHDNCLHGRWGRRGRGSGSGAGGLGPRAGQAAGHLAEDDSLGSARGSDLGGIEGVPQKQLEFGLGDDEAEHFGLLGIDEEVDDLNGGRLPVGVGFDILSGGEDFDVLEQGSGADAIEVRGAVLTGFFAEGDDIDAHARQDEAGDTDDIIDLDGDGTHTIGDFGSESGAAAFGAEAGLGEEFALDHGLKDGAVEELFLGLDGGFGQRGAPLLGAEVVLRERDAEGEIAGGDKDGGTAGTGTGETAGEQFIDRATRD